MSRPIPTILLDLDGTLVDSAPGILSSCRAALRALGHIPAPSLDLSTMIGPPIEDLMRLLLEPYGDDRVAEGDERATAGVDQPGTVRTGEDTRPASQAAATPRASSGIPV